MTKNDGTIRRGRPMVVMSKQEVVPTESQAMLDWGEQAGFLVKRRLHALGWGYAELARALEPLGIRRSATVLNRRINRENFSAGFFLACLEAMQDELVIQPKGAEPD